MNDNSGTADSVVSLESLLTDRQVASLLNLSVSWMRKQRHLRKAGKPHVFTVDAVFIGDVPRYRSSEIKEWLDGL